MLKIRFTDDRQPPFWAMEKNFTIGRSKSSHLTIDEVNVDNSHACIVHRDDNVFIKDLGSNSGTFVNGKRVTKKNISCGDVIRVGDTSLEITDPFESTSPGAQWSLIADSSWLTGQEFQLDFECSEDNDARLVIGRSNECDIVIPGTHLSRQHAEIRLQDNLLVLRDLGSSNGTFVNDQKVQSCTLKAGDRVRIDVYSFHVFGPGSILPRAATQTLKVISKELIADNKPKEKLWMTKSTSPGNREQIDLYKKRWAPNLLAASLLIGFCAIIAYLFIAH